MKKVYFISGLGADKRVFSLLDLSFCEPVYIEWIKPVNNESLASYALRLREQIKEISPTIAGISFGGMLSTEMAKADKNVKTIIISSSKTCDEFPSYLRIGKYFPIYKWSPASISKSIIIKLSWLLGRHNSQVNKLLRQIIRDSDISFINWAIGAIINWRNDQIPENLIHIHGTADRLLPFRYVKADYTLDGGTHVMTLDKHEEISILLKSLIH